ncbi:amidohydrolase family protein [Phyllobacterium sp. YR531]|uniref:amidohydrolase family protein n=1 Tax=Phyllobacterium sp. YR531 TaxID=1144343 RepID=UPI00026FC324|nr:amidohydrolase family protein [Phyllobacterium sp. YR531]EJN06821.1 putative TIM-barrel fold metal-dependent hydrolase [Phyllobacterium sp. YR531]
MGLVIDCHGHFTTEPPGFHAFRKAQVAFAEGQSRERPAYAGIADSELIDIIVNNQLRLQRERGSDLTILSPRASGMGHHVPGQDIAIEWARLSNDMIAHICDLFPRNFAGVCQLPQTVDGDVGPAIKELERCIARGFVGCNLNPDPSGGHWSAPPVYDPWWDPLWQAMIRLEVPAMIHVSGSCERCLHTTGAHYIAADTAVFMQLIEGDLFERHPALRLIIPHGGGAAPYHWGRYRGLSVMLGKPPLPEHLMQNLYFDTCVYHQAGIDLLFEIVDAKNILFGSELLGAVRATDSETGHGFDDTKRYIDALSLDEETQHAVFEGNVRRVYPRLDALLRAQGR